jgi:hypothetical protein
VYFGQRRDGVQLEEVTAELKCPVCMMYIMPPTPTCDNGHNICINSRYEMDLCASCKQQFSESGCWILENIQKIQYHCKYCMTGCEYVSTAGYDLTIHETHCIHRSFRFPFADDTICCWKDEMDIMWNHTEHRHSSQCATAAERKCTFTLNCSGPRPSRIALSVWGETFFVVSRVINFDLLLRPVCGSTCKGIFTQLHGGNFEEGQVCAQKSATVCHVTKSYFTDVQNIFRNPACAVFPYAIWNHCAGIHKKLSCEVEIR